MKTLTLIFMLGFISIFRNSIATSQIAQNLNFSPIGQKIYGDRNFNLICTSNSNLPITFSSNNSKVITINNNIATIVGAGTATITAYVSGNSQYEAATSTQIVTVYKKDLFAIAMNKIKTYGENNPSFNLIFTGFVNNENVSNLDVAPSAYVDQDKNSNAGNYPIKVTNGFDNNYNIFGVEGIFTIKKAPVIAKAKDIFVPFGQSIPTFECEFTGFINNDNASDFDFKPIIESSVSIGAPVGEYILSIHSGTDNNYEITTHIGGLLVIEQAPQAIVIDNISTLNLSNSNELILPNTSTAGLPISYTCSDETVAEIINNTLIAHKTGTIIITAEQNGDQNHKPAEAISRTVSIEKVGQITNTLNKVDESTIALYPNPAIDEFNIRTVQKIDHIDIYNLMGVLIYKEDVNNNEWNHKTTNLQRGQYLIQFKFADNSIGSKMLTVN